MSGRSCAYALVVAIVVAVLASACGTTARSPEPSPTATATPTLPPVVSPGVTAALPAGTARSAGVRDRQLSRSTPWSCPSGWFDLGGRFVLKYTGTQDPGPCWASVCGTWDWSSATRATGRARSSTPGPGVENLVAALVAQKMRNATPPTDVTLAGYAGKYLEWSVPADLKSSAWSSFDACDLDSDGDPSRLPQLAWQRHGRSL